ncbi:hypothetical protein HZS_6505 [Henneguya salminicola]|nr:hypothetical protein HZS_6505 [Henneguya salminicola]
MIFFYSKILIYLLGKSTKTGNDFISPSKDLILDDTKTRSISCNVESNGRLNTDQQSKEKLNLVKKIAPMIILVGIFFFTWAPFIIIRWLRVYKEDMSIFDINYSKKIKLKDFPDHGQSAPIFI